MRAATLFNQQGNYTLTERTQSDIARGDLDSLDSRPQKYHHHHQHLASTRKFVMQIYSRAQREREREELPPYTCVLEKTFSPHTRMYPGAMQRQHTRTHCIHRKMHKLNLNAEYSPWGGEKGIWKDWGFFPSFSRPAARAGINLVVCVQFWRLSLAPHIDGRGGESIPCSALRCSALSESPPSLFLSSSSSSSSSIHRVCATKNKGSFLLRFRK